MIFRYNIPALFPKELFEDLGYNVVVDGQKTFNGVAIASLLPFENVCYGLPGEEKDAQARYIEATFFRKKGPLRFASLYAPNGNPLGSEKFGYKLEWLKRLHTYAVGALTEEIPIVLAGDYNIIPEATDAKHPELWKSDALFQPEPRMAWRKILNLGYTDALRSCHPGPGCYTFWDYQAGAWQKNNGIRIDHLLLSPQATDGLKSAAVDTHVRGCEKPSDHVPVRIDLEEIGRAHV